MKWLRQPSTAVDAADVELFPLFLLCQLASLYLSSHCSGDNFFSVSLPQELPYLSPFPKSLHLAEYGITDLRFVMIVILAEQPLPAQGADLAHWAPLQEGVGQGWALPQPGLVCLGTEVFILAMVYSVSNVTCLLEKGRIKESLI